jgi:hypothetical protein
MFAKTSLETPQDKRMLKEATTRIAEKRVRADEVILFCTNLCQVSRARMLDVDDSVECSFQTS